MTLTAFSWGYAGWGPYTAELVALVDRVERARGFAPPLFVDIRLRRSVRAPGFRDRAFAELLGPDRHVWMPELGNLAIADRALAMTIAKPAAAGALLDTIERSNRRVIFFCSCASPTRRHSCHRGLVTQLLVAAARERGTPLTIREWPGGEPTLHDATVSPADFAALKRHLRADRAITTIAVPEAFTLEQAGALAHLTILHANEQLWAVSGPAIFGAKGWRLPVYRTSARAVPLEDVRETFAEWQLGPFA